MGKKIEVLLSVMNIKNEIEYDELLKKNNIKGKVVTINQVENKEEIFSVSEGEKRIYSYAEKGASNSRNKLLEKANGDICIFADNDTVFVEDYEKIIEKEFVKNPKADIIIFFAENENKAREPNKRIGNKKINYLDIMRVRTNEIALKKETIEKIKEKNIKFDCNFGPGGIFKKGEETIFMAELKRLGLKIYSVDINISTSKNEKSTWFTGFNEQFLYDQGAIFYKLAPKWYQILILQYIIRKHFLYKNNLNIFQAYKQLLLGVKECKKIYT